MKLDLADIAGTPGTRGRYSISEHVAPTEELSCTGPVVGVLEVENSGSLLLVRGKLRGVVRLRCVRCLGSLECPLDVAVEEEFATQDTEEGVATMDRDEPETSAMAEYVLDVSEFVRQQLLVNTPMAPVCREGCRGICAGCGQNLNDGNCECTGEQIDSRWAGLAGLLPRDAGERKHD